MPRKQEDAMDPVQVVMKLVLLGVLGIVAYLAGRTPPSDPPRST